MSKDLNTPIWQLTVGEFIELQQRAAPPPQQAQAAPPAPPGKKLVYGITGLAELLGCSKTTAQKIKSSGRIKKAVKQHGRKIIIDADLALELLGRN